MKYLIMMVVAVLVLRWFWRGQAALSAAVSRRAPLSAEDETTAYWRIRFGDWLRVLYRDRPEAVELVFQAVQNDDTLKAGEDLRPEVVMNYGVGEQLHADHAFLVDWKEGEAFIEWSAEMAARFGFELVWSDRNRREDIPETLMQLAYKQFLAHGAVLYNANNDGDYYCLLVVPQQDCADFEAASIRWGLQVRTADMPY